MNTSGNVACYDPRPWIPFNANIDKHPVQLREPAAMLSLQALPEPANCTIEIWRFPDRCQHPLVERL